MNDQQKLNELVEFEELLKDISGDALLQMYLSVKKDKEEVEKRFKTIEKYVKDLEPQVKIINDTQINIYEIQGRTTFNLTEFKKDFPELPWEEEKYQKIGKISKGIRTTLKNIN